VGLRARYYRFGDRVKGFGDGGQGLEVESLE
jgi:hypothetical protein